MTSPPTFTVGIFICKKINNFLPTLRTYYVRGGYMDQIIILDGNVVGLVSDSGAARWEFEDLEDAVELYRLLVLSVDVEDRIAELSNKSL